MLWHKKSATAPDTEDPDLVGSQHWNDVHGYGAGAFIPVVSGEFEFTPPSSTGVSASGPCASGASATNPYAGQFSVPITAFDPALKADPSLEVSYNAVFTGFGAMPAAGWRWSISVEGDDVSGWSVVFRHEDSEAAQANPTIYSRLFFAVYATFWEPS